MISLRHILRQSALLAFAACLPGSAHAALSIGFGSTVNVNCNAGVCTATAQNAVLGIKRLQNLLANGDVTVAAGEQANDITADAPFSWVSGHGLTLDSRHSIRVERTIDVAGPGALALVTNHGLAGGTLSFGVKGNVHFWSTANSLTIDGQAYTLVDTIASLAGAVASAPSGRYALANAYDATADGIYALSPIPTNFTGVFEGLGNAISNLRIDSTARAATGLFSLIYFGGAVENLALRNINVHGGDRASIGGLAGANFGRIENVTVRGIVTAGRIVSVGLLVGGNSYGTRIINSSTAGTVRGAYASSIGGLTGYDSGGDLNIIVNSHSSATVIAAKDSHAGGLVGLASALVTKSWASGSVTIGDEKDSAPIAAAGGLIGYFTTLSGSNVGVTNCYASGAVTASAGAAAGGLIGIHYMPSGGNGPITASYSFGAVTAGAGGYSGGLIGFRAINPATANTYWDLDTSGISDPSKGAGNHANDPGITGLTTVQLQSGLPAGFSAAVWAQNPHYLGGRPFLISNLPD
jgi:hypothetical protein